MNAVHYFDSISIPPPYEQIYRRLGFRKGITSLSPREKTETERSIDTALSLIRLQGAARRLPIRKEGDAHIILPDGVTLDSRQLSKFLGDCDEILLMGATAGPEIMQTIQTDAAGRNVTRGVVLDAAASEITDTALDWIAGYFDQILRRERKGLLHARYSAGYGDLLLENQRTMHRLLTLEKIGVTITESCILIPEKSVTAITGIRQSS
jgi:hypothetical protein